MTSLYRSVSIKGRSGNGSLVLTFKGLDYHEEQEPSEVINVEWRQVQRVTANVSTSMTAMLKVTLTRNLKKLDANSLVFKFPSRPQMEKAKADMTARVSWCRQKEAEVQGSRRQQEPNDQEMFVSMPEAVRGEPQPPPPPPKMHRTRSQRIASLNSSRPLRSLEEHRRASTSQLATSSPHITSVQTFADSGRSLRRRNSTSDLSKQEKKRSKAPRPTRSFSTQQTETSHSSTSLSTSRQTASCPTTILRVLPDNQIMLCKRDHDSPWGHSQSQILLDFSSLDVMDEEQPSFCGDNSESIPTQVSACLDRAPSGRLVPSSELISQSRRQSSHEVTIADANHCRGGSHPPELQDLETGKLNKIKTQGTKNDNWRNDTDFQEDRETIKTSGQDKKDPTGGFHVSHRACVGFSIACCCLCVCLALVMVLVLVFVVFKKEDNNDVSTPLVAHDDLVAEFYGNAVDDIFGN